MPAVETEPHRGNSASEGSRGTLGEVLYARPSQPLVAEKDWVGLVRFVAAGDPLALQALYERTHRLVFTLIMRLTSNREAAERLTLDVFHDLWRLASRHDPASGTVLGWIMNLARSKAIEHLRSQERNKAARASQDAALLTIDAPDYRDVLRLKEQSQTLATALAALTASERQALEAAFFGELTHVQVAALLNQPRGAIRPRIRAALHKLQQALALGPAIDGNLCEQAELTCVYAVRALAPAEVSALEAHLSNCWRCRRELETLRPVVDAFIAWPTDILRPAASLQSRLAQQIATQTGDRARLPEKPSWAQPQWDDVAPGISCKLLATDTQQHAVSMLVRLVPGGEYPAHTHAGVEELHLLAGELWIDERRLVPGDYNRAEPGTADRRVWSETGCTCVLVTSSKDILTTT
jgi:RNA polymerase sigma-70 factor (ECF subfamily)